MVNSYYIYPHTLHENYSTSFCFITSSYNQQQFINTNLDSILSQNYHSYRIIYINDASTDNSLEILNNFIHTHPDIDIRLINNKKRLGPAYSRFRGCREAYDNEICVFLDGDDRLYSENVLRILAEIYQNNNIHATFGSMNNWKWNFRQWKSYTRNSKHKFYPHLRTAKAYYCKKVPESYLKDSNGRWFMFCTDIALFTSIIELIDYNYVFIKNPLLIYNNYNSLNNPVEGFNKQNIINRHKRNLYHKDIKNMPVLLPIIENKIQLFIKKTGFLIFRMLGNDLLGLHGDNQTFTNLLFTINHEIEFKNTDKLYVLNRITDMRKKTELIKLLNANNIKYIDIPFNLTEFNELPLLDITIEQFKKMTHQGEIIKYLYTYNQILINNNHCRNFCIEYGKRAGYKWIFVLDSNSFFTKESYHTIINNINIGTQYLIIPQKRLKDGEYVNNDLLDTPFIENVLPIQEPQIAFRNTSEYMFNPNIPYGAIPKAEFLNAMGVKGKWNKWGSFLKYLDIKIRNINKPYFQIISSVIRLHPHNITNRMSDNWNKRMEGLYILIDTIQQKSNIVFNDPGYNSDSGDGEATTNTISQNTPVEPFLKVYNFFN